MKFNTLTHNGPVFSKEYEVKGFTIKGKLTPLAEEMLWKFTPYMETDYVKDPVFIKNFYSCLETELSTTQKKLEFPKDFKPLFSEIRKAQLELKEAKKIYNKEHKAEIEKVRQDQKDKYGYALLDEQKQPLGAYIIEDTGIFMTRGANPLKGLWKYRTQPESVTINYVGKGKPPKAPVNHKWKEVVSNTNGLWTARYDIDVGHKHTVTKSIMFGATSTVKASADQKKFAKATDLLLHWQDMQNHIEEGLASNDSKIRQCAIISYLIQCSGIRIGHERDLDTMADTCGASTLYSKNIATTKDSIILDFLGKDSVPYHNEIKISNKAFLKALNKQKSLVTEDEHLFSVNADNVNTFLSEAVSCTTAKLFRTAVGTKTLCDVLKESKIPENASIDEKLEIFTKANLEVAIRLNHQKVVPPSWDKQLNHLNEQIDIQKQRILKITKDCNETEIASKTKVEKIAKEVSSDTLTFLISKEKEKADKLALKLEKAKQRLANLLKKLALKKATKGMTLNTSKTNYSSPRITWSYCKANGIPIDKIFSKVLQQKFAWAADTDEDYYLNYPNLDSTYRDSE